jgi:hypothetical protein
VAEYLTGITSRNLFPRAVKGDQAHAHPTRKTFFCRISTILYTQQGYPRKNPGHRWTSHHQFHAPVAGMSTSPVAPVTSDLPRGGAAQCCAVLFGVTTTLSRCGDKA